MPCHKAHALITGGLQTDKHTRIFGVKREWSDSHGAVGYTQISNFRRGRKTGGDQGPPTGEEKYWGIFVWGTLYLVNIERCWLTC